jgi:3-(3-hydroxy-phenyl)propionate hydroxylase
MLFCDGAPDAVQAALLQQLGQLDKRFVWLLIQRQASLCQASLCQASPGVDVSPKAKTIPDENGKITALFGAQPGTLYLLRPDLHIAGRWKTVIAGEIMQTAQICLGRPTS